LRICDVQAIKSPKNPNHRNKKKKLKNPNQIHKKKGFDLDLIWILSLKSETLVHSTYAATPYLWRCASWGVKIGKLQRKKTKSDHPLL
jgi:hypothetical protein